MTAFFIAGTDTEIGKTFTTCALLHRARAQGLNAVAYKPVAAGAEMIEGEWSNGDARALLAASSPGFTLAQINPLCLREAAAPHIAAANEGRRIELAPLLAGFAALRDASRLVLVEGVGGFCVPLAEDLDTADLAVALQLPVLLVVGMRLGCINHALLTVEAIRARGLALAGWYANSPGPEMMRLTDNIVALRQRIAAPLFGVLPHSPQGPAQAAAGLALPPPL